MHEVDSSLRHEIIKNAKIPVTTIVHPTFVLNLHRCKKIDFWSTIEAILNLLTSSQRMYWVRSDIAERVCVFDEIVNENIHVGDVVYSLRNFHGHLEVGGEGCLNN